MSYTPLLIALLLHTGPTIPAELTDRDVFERAEAEFLDGVNLRQARDQAQPHFRNAASYFEELRRRGIGNADLYRNLGNAHLLAGDLPQSILSYHRGLHLSPNDLRLRESLAEARERVVYPSSGDLGRPRPENRPPWLPHIGSRWLMFAAVICYVLGCLALMRWRIMFRSNSAKAPLMWNSSLPAGVVVSMCC